MANPSPAPTRLPAPVIGLGLLVAAPVVVGAALPVPMAEVGEVPLEAV